jgi:hypothetical protein
MVVASGGVVCINRIDGSESRRRGTAVLMSDVLCWTHAGWRCLSGAMVASITDLARAMRISALKMDQR